MDKNLPDWEKNDSIVNSMKMLLPPALDIVLDAMGIGIVGKVPRSMRNIFLSLRNY